MAARAVGERSTKRRPAVSLRDHITSARSTVTAGAPASSSIRSVTTSPGSSRRGTARSATPVRGRSPAPPPTVRSPPGPPSLGGGLPQIAPREVPAHLRVGGLADDDRHAELLGDAL